MGREIGSAIFLANEEKGVKVDLTDPDVTFYVEARDNRAFIFQDYIKCHAGLPVGTQGKVLVQLDGSERSVVSAWLMMKRGCRVMISGDADFSMLKQYDSYLRQFNPQKDDEKRILGIVMGTDFSDLGDVDVSQYPYPVFFPTIGMTDDEVDTIMDTIKLGL